MVYNCLIAKLLYCYIVILLYCYIVILLYCCIVKEAKDEAFKLFKVENFLFFLSLRLFQQFNNLTI